MPLRAPVFDEKFFRRNPVRLPRRRDLLGLQTGFPYWIPIFDAAALVVNAGAVWGIGQSLENNFVLAIDFAWLGAIANGSGTSFAWQLSRTTRDAKGNQQTYRFQKSPLLQQTHFGTAQKPLYFREAVYLPAGTELVCRVQNTSGAALAIPPLSNNVQVVLFGQIQG
jgi:hypothetical protein